MDVRYDLRLAWLNLTRSRGITALMVLAIGLGVGACMTMLTVLHVMDGDPLPARSARLFRVVMDPQPGHAGKLAHRNLTYIDAQNLLHDGSAVPRAAIAAGEVVLSPPGQGASFAHGRFATAAFFAMFGVPMRYGRAWARADDERRSQVVVLGAALNRRLFDGADSVGREVTLSGHLFRVIGVAEDWNLAPKVYADLSQEPFGAADEFFAPLSTAMQLKLDFTGHLSCWGDGGDRRGSSDCAWLQFWAQLDTPAQQGAYRARLLHYAQSQRAPDRFQRVDGVALVGMMPWLRHVGVVPGEVRLQAWLALGFLLVCLANIVGLLLAKFLRRAGEISVRRALGARRRDILRQLVAEALMIGVLGGVLGFVFTMLGLWQVRRGPDRYAHVAHMDLPMLAVTLLLGVTATLLAALVPAWRSCRVPPALHLKTT